MRKLLFVTSAAKLEENIGRSEAKQILNAFEKQRIPIYSELPAGLKKSAEATAYVQQILAGNPSIKGVVIIGGYDAVPAQILDALPPNLRRALPPNDDPRDASRFRLSRHELIVCRHLLQGGNANMRPGSSLRELILAGTEKIQHNDLRVL